MKKLKKPKKRPEKLWRVVDDAGDLVATLPAPSAAAAALEVLTGNMCCKIDRVFE